MRSGGEREHQGNIWEKRMSLEKIAKCSGQGPQLARGTVMGARGMRLKREPDGRQIRIEQERGKKTQSLRSKAWQESLMG